MEKFFNDIGASFVRTFITENRWMMLLQGLGTTLSITFFAVLLGIALGFLVAVVRSTYDMQLKDRK